MDDYRAARRAERNANDRTTEDRDYRGFRDSCGRRGCAKRKVDARRARRRADKAQARAEIKSAGY